MLISRYAWNTWRLILNQSLMKAMQPWMVQMDGVVDDWWMATMSQQGSKIRTSVAREVVGHFRVTEVVKMTSERFSVGDPALTAWVTPHWEGQPRSDNHKEHNAAPGKMPLPCGLYREHCKLLQSGYKLTRSIKKCAAITRGEKVERKVPDLPMQCNRFQCWAWVTTDFF